uniref:Uncharacterized protein n=2 Tax=viral metagenome TaxID=1070528 RepID=A0A6M3JUX9_9ZZZZ
MSVELDYFEYATDGAAAAAFVSNGGAELVVTSESTIKTQGSYSLKAIASTSSLNKTLTRTMLGTDYVDQSQIIGDVDGNLGDVAGVEKRDAQSFKLSKSLTVTAVEVKQNTTTGTPSGNWTLRIETDNAGVPSGTLADANASIVVAPPGNGNVVKGTFATPFILAGATSYWLVVQCDNQTTNNRWTIGWDDTPAYANGMAAQSNDGTWTAYSAYDLYFKIYVNDPFIDLSSQTKWKFDMRASRTGSNVKIGIHDSGGTTTETTPNITSADTFQTVSVDISGVADANKDAIDSIIITPTNADSANTIYIDNMFGTIPIDWIPKVYFIT